MTLRIGLSAYNIAVKDLVELAAAADELGFESLWLGEHIVLPLDYGSHHPTDGTTARQHHTGPIVDPNTVLVDPLVALSAAAAVTKQIKLATGIYILPLRNPLISARMTATLDDVTNGRFILGVGSGWLEEEFDAIGVPFAERRGRYEEAIEILRLSWKAEPFSFAGKHYAFGRVQMSPTLIGVPLVLGGNTEPALRRAATIADGWFSSGTPSLVDSVRLRDRLAVIRQERGLTNPFSIHVRTASAEADFRDGYEAEGFENVLVWADQVWPATGDLASKRATLTMWANRLGVTPLPVQV